MEKHGEERKRKREMEAAMFSFVEFLLMCYGLSNVSCAHRVISLLVDGLASLLSSPKESERTFSVFEIAQSRNTP